MGARVSSHVCHHTAGKKPVRTGDRMAQPTAEKLLTSLTEREVGVSHQEKCFTPDLLPGDLLFRMQRGLLSSTTALQ